MLIGLGFNSVDLLNSFKLNKNGLLGLVGLLFVDCCLFDGYLHLIRVWLLCV